MSNQVTKYEELSPEQLLALTGQAQANTNYSDFPRVTINKLGEDEQERAIPVGAYMVSQDGKAVFGKPILFRPFLNAYQYAVYDAASNTYPNKSIIFKSFREEAVDELGGVACGKVSAKKREGLTPDQLAIQKAIKCYRTVYGLVTFTGTTADGQSVDITDLPVKFRLSGDNFMPIQDVLDELSKKKLSMLNYQIELSTKRKKNGTNVYYQMVPALKDTYVPIRKEDWGILASFQDAIDTENKAIIDKHHKARQATTQAEEDKGALIELGAELNDDISDVL